MTQHRRCPEQLPQPLQYCQLKMTKQRNLGIDLLKVVSTLYIVGFWHLFDYVDDAFNVSNPFTVQLTGILLGAFTLISAYFVGRSKPPKTARSVVEFYRKKLLRLYPLYGLAILLFFAMGLTEGVTALKAAVLVSMLSRPAPLTLWFITMVMLFYLVSPLLLLGFDERPQANLTAPRTYWLTCAILFISLVLCSWKLPSIDFRLLTYFPCYIIGLALPRYLPLLPQPITTVVALSLTGFGAGLLNSVDPDSALVSVLLAIPLVLAGALSLFMLCFNLQLPAWIASPIKLLSYCSFGAYLFHRVVFESLIRLYFPGNAAAQVVYLMALGVPLIEVVAGLLQQGYDRLL